MGLAHPRSPAPAAEEAVSPVIGVILLVAITVVLAAVVFVLASKLSEDDGDAGATFAATKDETRDYVNVAAAGIGYNYGQFEILADAPIAFRLNGRATLTATETGSINAPTNVPTVIDPSATAALTGGSFVSICGGTITAGGVQSNVDVRIRHVDSNKMVFSGRYVTVAACA